MGRPRRRAHLNMIENLVLFAALVLIAAVAGKANATTAMGAMIFFWGRLAYAVIYLVGIPWLRTLAWFVSVIGMAMIAWVPLACAGAAMGAVRSRPFARPRVDPATDRVDRTLARAEVLIAGLDGSAAGAGSGAPPLSELSALARRLGTRRLHQQLDVDAAGLLEYQWSPAPWRPWRTAPSVP